MNFHGRIAGKIPFVVLLPLRSRVQALSYFSLLSSQQRFDSKKRKTIAFSFRFSLYLKDGFYSIRFNLIETGDTFGFQQSDLLVLFPTSSAVLLFFLAVAPEECCPSFI
ncbi:hypothetical protein [Aneurinibacillus soli]|nr:hypothetical protein [Aneurinibacillus soli]